MMNVKDDDDMLKQGTKLNGPESRPLYLQIQTGGN